jgi:hypothetical protein
MADFESVQDNGPITLLCTATPATCNFDVPSRASVTGPCPERRGDAYQVVAAAVLRYLAHKPVPAETLCRDLDRVG